MVRDVKAKSEGKASYHICLLRMECRFVSGVVQGDNH